MKRWIIAAVFVLGWAAPALSADPAPLTALREVHQLTNQEADHKLPVVLEATVTYYRSYEYTLFVQDEGLGIYVYFTGDAKVVPGDHVLIRGTTDGSFRPIIDATSIKVLSHGSLPEAVPATYEDLVQTKDDCRLVRVRGIVRTVDAQTRLGKPSTRMQLLMDGGYVDILTDIDNFTKLGNILDAEVEITAVAAGNFDGKMQETGMLLHVASIAGIKVIKQPSASPWSLPFTPMDQIIAYRQIIDHTSRVRVHGTITYYQAGSTVVIQDGAKSLLVNTESFANLRLGDLAEVTGFPTTRNGFLALDHAEIEDKQIYAPIQPKPATWTELASSRHIFDLVSIEGQVVTVVRLASQDEYILLADGQIFSAIYRHVGGVDIPPLKEVPAGTRIRVTGICMLDDANPYNGQIPFNILLRSFDDVTPVAPAPLLNIRNLSILVGLLLIGIVIAALRSWTLERKVRLQTATLASRVEQEAALERSRSRILEDINGSEPLANILEQITDLTSSMLSGAPCWCRISDGATLGKCPPAGHDRREVAVEIPARSGPPLGTLFAAVDSLVPPHEAEAEAMEAGARMATLAIETRRLYSDLVRRSEFDLLTDVHNRFSLDKLLDARIAEARRVAGIFGLIYIDLDKFKQVNDRYGHHIGDLYLQEVAVRMKSQLRGGDMLARLGGDEFAALLTLVRCRSDVEEVARRMRHSFDEPFLLEGNILHGAASIGYALYPEDGTNKSTLLSAADASMYVVKNAHHTAADYADTTVE